MTRRRAILPLTIPAALSAALMFDCSPAATTDGGLEGGADVVANDTRDSASNDVSPDVRDVDADATVTTDASDALPPDAPDSSNTDAATDGGPSPCDPGYTSDGAGGCMDIDECTTGNGGCGTARCSNAPGSFHCFDNPLSLVLSGEVSTRIAGPGGSLHSALCPAGQLLIGLDSSYISGFGASSVSGVCAVATLTGTPAAGYSITVAPEPGGPSGQNPWPPTRSSSVPASAWTRTSRG